MYIEFMLYMFKETNSYARTCQEPIKEETKIVDLAKYEEEGDRFTVNVLEDLEGSLKSLDNERRSMRPSKK